MTTGLDDERLIEACLAGEKEAFGSLVRRYQDRLYPTIFRISGCAEDSQDLLQDAFLRAFEKLDRFRGGSSFYTWLYRIAVNVALSSRRRRRGSERGRRLAQDIAQDATQTDPSLPAERTEREVLIQNALNALAPDHRVVILLKDFDGLRYEQIATILDIPVGTVRSRLHRARTELKPLLQPLADDQRSPRTGDLSEH